MFPIKITFDKLECGTTFFDPLTEKEYIKCSETHAEVLNDFALDTEEFFDPFDVVIVP